MTSQPIPQRESRTWLVIVVIVLAVGVASVWTFIARNQLQASIAQESSQHLIGARKAFDGLRSQTQTNLTSHCRVLVEDPRLKATLATEGINAATVADILQDLSKLRRSGFLLVLSPDGRVFAQAGALPAEGLESILRQVRALDMKKVHEELASRQDPAGAE